MHVLVSVEMRGRNPGAFYLRDLRVPFPLDLVQRKTPRGDAQKQTFRPAFQIAGLVQEPRNAGSRSRRWPITQIQVHADAKFGMIAAHGESRFKGAAICQKGSAGHQSAPVGIRDSAVDPLGPTQVVGIHYQILQLRSSLSFRTATLSSALPY